MANKPMKNPGSQSQNVAENMTVPPDQIWQNNIPSEISVPFIDLRLNPEQRLCPMYDETSIAMYRVGDREHMGMRVRDNCAEENIQ